jgi:hypothetical protein
MFEMQDIRMLHCTIWVGGVREIVSAEDSDVSSSPATTPSLSTITRSLRQIGHVRTRSIPE